MKTRARGPATSIVLMVLVAALAACDNDGSSDPAATVGTVEISREQLEADVAAFRFFAGQSDTACGEPPGGTVDVDECTRVVLANDIQEEIVKRYAAENDLVVDQADLTAAIAELETANGGAEALDAALADAGLDRDGLVALVERLLLFEVVQGAVADERADEDALAALYEESKEALATVEVAHILLPTIEQARQVAAEATPENFAALASANSIDPGSAPSGGSLGTFSAAEFRQTFDPTFVEAALALEPGEISGVVKTSFGFHVIRLLERDVPTLEEARGQLLSMQSAQVYGDWLKERYESLDIEVDPGYGRLDPATGQVVAGAEG